MKTGNTYAVAGLLAMSVLLGGLTGCPLFWKITATPENVTVAVDATKDVAVVSTDRNDTTFEWVSDNEAVATVAAVGNGATATVTGVAEGTATLTVTGADSNLSDTVNVTVFVDLASIGERFSSSLHGTRVGKATWYNGTEAEPGLLSLTGIPMEELPCMGCHGPNYADGTPVDAGSYTAGCGDCHVDPEHPAAITDQAVCLPCHSRQGREIQMDNAGNPLFDDVHRNAGMTCMSCHKFDEIHGDGTAYTSILESPSADCEDCHVEGGTAPVPPANHEPHGGKLHCSACHVETVISCYNCHLESEVEAHQKRPFTMISGFALLVNNVVKDQVQTASFQSVTYEGNKFVAIGAFHGHTVVQGSARTCNECHNNANVQTYNDTGELKIGTWNEETDTVAPIAGVVPVPEDYKTSLQFDFLTYTGNPADPVPATPAEVTPAYREAWELEPGVGDPDTGDLIQMADGLVAPLTDAQMNLLSTPMGGK